MVPTLFTSASTGYPLPAPAHTHNPLPTTWTSFPTFWHPLLDWILLVSAWKPITFFGKPFNAHFLLPQRKTLHCKTRLNYVSSPSSLRAGTWSVLLTSASPELNTINICWVNGGVNRRRLLRWGNISTESWEMSRIQTTQCTTGKQTNLKLSARASSQEARNSMCMRTPTWPPVPGSRAWGSWGWSCREESEEARVATQRRLVCTFWCWRVPEANKHRGQTHRWEPNSVGEVRDTWNWHSCNQALTWSFVSTVVHENKG